MRQRLFAVMFSLFFLTWPSVVRALEFSEIAYDILGSDTDREWVELHNETDAPIDLTGFTFFDGANHQLIVPPDKGSQGSLVIAPDQYLILADDAVRFLSDHPGYADSVIDTIMNLPNYSAKGSEKLLELHSKQKDVLASVAYLPSSQGAQGRTLEKQPTGSFADSAAVGGSPGKQATLATPPGSPPLIHFSEIFSNPAGSDNGQEWLEVVNDGSLPYELTNLTVLVGDGSTKLHFDSTVLGVGAYLALYLTGSPLRNSELMLTLVDQSGQNVDSLTLAGSAKENMSYALLGGQWQWTNQFTPDQPNKLSVVLSTPDTKSTKIPAVERASPVVAAVPRPVSKSTSVAASPKIAPSVLSPSVLPRSTTVHAAGTIHSPSPKVQSTKKTQSSPVAEPKVVPIVLGSMASQPRRTYPWPAAAGLALIVLVLAGIVGKRYRLVERWQRLVRALADDLPDG